MCVLNSLYAHYILIGRIVPKARPRVGIKKTFLPDGYFSWLENATLQLLIQQKAQPEIRPPFYIHCEYQGKAVGDPDNILGAVLDALVKASIIPDDRLNIVPSLHFKWFKSSDCKADIKIYSLLE